MLLSSYFKNNYKYILNTKWTLLDTLWFVGYHEVKNVFMIGIQIYACYENTAA